MNNRQNHTAQDDHATLHERIEAPLWAENERLKAAAELYKTQANDSRLFADMKKEECRQLRAELAALKHGAQKPTACNCIAECRCEYPAPATDYKNVAERLLGAVCANHSWPLMYDEHDGYQESELGEKNVEAIAAAKAAGLKGEE